MSGEKAPETLCERLKLELESKIELQASAASKFAQDTEKRLVDLIQQQQEQQADSLSEVNKAVASLRSELHKVSSQQQHLATLQQDHSPNKTF